MKRFAFCFIILTCVGLHAADFQNGNGTIIQRYSTNEISWTIRKHSQELIMDSWPDQEHYYIYSEPTLDVNKRIFSLKKGEEYQCIEIATATSAQKNTTNWIKVKTQTNKIGWKFLGNSDPYQNDQWSIEDVIKTINRIWTIRKIEGTLATEQTVTIQEKPGENSSNILTKITVPENDWINIRIIAISEEEDTIDSISDHWVKVITSDGIYGWVFGGFLTAMRGGPKYLTPEEIVLSQVNYGI
jgi:hypothetical protein